MAESKIVYVLYFILTVNDTGMYNGRKLGTMMINQQGMWIVHSRGVS